MKTKNDNNISESQVEDSLVANLSFLAKILKLPTELKLITRQLRLKSGDKRIDLLLTSGKSLCLVEIKVVPFSEDWLKQIISYRDELIRLQNTGELISGEILCFLLVTNADNTEIELARQNGIIVNAYEPINVLKEYYEKLAVVAPFLKIKPND
jgi:hypothetical protein